MDNLVLREMYTQIIDILGGVNGSGVEDLIRGFDVIRHTRGEVANSGSRRGSSGNRTSFA